MNDGGLAGPERSINDESPVEQLLADLEHGSMSVKEAATRKFFSLQGLPRDIINEARESITGFLAWTTSDLQPIIGQNGDKVLELLTEELECGSPAEAAVALGRIGDHRAIEPLLEALLTPDSATIRRTFATALSRLGQPQWQDCIEEGYEAECVGWIRDLCRFIAAGHPKAFDELVGAAKSNTDYGNTEAICALALIGGSRSVEALTSVLERLVQPKNLGTSWHSKACIAMRALAELAPEVAASWLATKTAASAGDSYTMKILDSCQRELGKPKDSPWPDYADTLSLPQVREPALLARAAINRC